MTVGEWRTGKGSAQPLMHARPRWPWGTRGAGPMDLGAGERTPARQVRFLLRLNTRGLHFTPWSAWGARGICPMAKGFFIRERDAEAVLQALEVIRSALLDDDQKQPSLAGLGVSEPTPAEEPEPGRRDPEEDAARVQAAREYVASVDAGQAGRFRPQPRSKSPVPRCADFIDLFLGAGQFSLATAAERIRPYVQLSESNRKARASLRTALDGDRRFEKVAAGRYRKRA